MPLRKALRLASTLAVAGVTFITAASCGGNSGDTQGRPDSSDWDHFAQLIVEGGHTGACKPSTCTTLGYSCGDNADGCGGLLHCGTCTGTDFCGGGGFSKCGNPNLTPDGAPVHPCMAKTCGDYPASTCGQQSDGCGGLTPACGATDAGLCPIGQFCGGGGASLCGTGITDAGDAGICTAKTCTDYPAGRCGLRWRDGELHDVHQSRVLRRRRYARRVRRQQRAVCRRWLELAAVRAKDLLGLPRGHLRHPGRRLWRSDRAVHHVREPFVLRRGWSEPVRRRRWRVERRRRRNVHSEDLRGLSIGYVRAAVQRLRRLDRQLQHLHEPSVLRRRRARAVRGKQRTESGWIHPFVVRPRDVHEQGL
jgi:hypothetical protein